MKICSFVTFAFVCIAFVAGLLVAASARGEDLVVAANGVHPGQLWLSEGGTAERLLHRRADRADPAFPRAIMRISQVALPRTGGGVYFASGLDHYIMHQLPSGHEVLSFEAEGQVRDLACTAEERVVYYSVVPTPQNGEALADGVIYRRDLGDARASVVAIVRQADVGGQWWGTFTIHQGAVIVATHGTPSRLYKVTPAGPVRIFEGNTSGITGLASGVDGSLFFATGAAKVYRTRDFVTLQGALLADRPLSDVSLIPASESGRP